MVNYFDAFKLWTWKEDSLLFESFGDKLTKLDWKIIFLLNLFVFILFYVIPTVVLSLDFDFRVFSMILTFPILYLIYIFGGFYFTNLFFKSDLTSKQFYAGLNYLILPLFLLNLFIIFISFTISLDDNVSSIYIIIFLIIFILYNAIKCLNTILLFFSEGFNCSQWALAGIVFLWGLVFSFIVNIFSFLVFTLIMITYI